jgi:hypothetical protein
LDLAAKTYFEQFVSPERTAFTIWTLKGFDSIDVYNLAQLFEDGCIFLSQIINFAQCKRQLFCIVHFLLLLSRLRFSAGVVAQIKSIWARLSAIKKLEKSGFWGFKASVKRETVSL